MVSRENMPNYVRMLTIFGNAEASKHPIYTSHRGQMWFFPKNATNLLPAVHISGRLVVLLPWPALFPQPLSGGYYTIYFSLFTGLDA